MGRRRRRRFSISRSNRASNARYIELQVGMNECAGFRWRVGDLCERRLNAQRSFCRTRAGDNQWCEQAVPGAGDERHLVLCGILRVLTSRSSSVMKVSLLMSSALIENLSGKVRLVEDDEQP